MYVCHLRAFANDCLAVASVGVPVGEHVERVRHRGEPRQPALPRRELPLRGVAHLDGHLPVRDHAEGVHAELHAVRLLGARAPRGDIGNEVRCSPFFRLLPTAAALILSVYMCERRMVNLCERHMVI